MKAYVIAHSTDLKSVVVYSFTSKEKANAAVDAVTEKEPSTVCVVAAEEGDLTISGVMMASLYRRVAGDASLTRFSTKADGQRRLFSAMRDNGNAQEADLPIKPTTSVKVPKEKKVKVPKEKKVKVPKEKKVKVPKEKKEGSKSHINKDLKIAIVSKENPRRNGTKGWDTFNLYKNGMTVSQLIAAGGRLIDLRADADKGHITLS